MTDHTPATDPTVDPALTEQAQELTRRRFSLAGALEPPMDLLFERSVERTENLMRSYPEWFGRAHRFAPAPASPAAPQKTVDPMALLRGGVKLPSLPAVFLELQQAIDNPRTSASDLAKVISKDPSLSAFLLRMVNSAFYSFPQQVETISRAVAIVGVRQLSTLAVGTSVLNLFKDIPPDVLDMEQFWLHSISTGLIARELSRELKVAEPEKCFVGGLLHDIGRLVIFKHLPDRARNILARFHHRNMLLIDAENEELGFDHAKLGGMLLRMWNFPYPLVSAVLTHHDPPEDKLMDLPGIVHAANILAVALGNGTEVEAHVPPSVQTVWPTYGIDTPRLARILDRVDEQVDEMFAVLTAAHH